MSARDAESGSSTYKGGSGRAGGLGNGGIGGGMGGGGMGGGAGRNAGMGSNTGMQTGNTWHGNSAYGQAGGNVQAYGMRDAASLARAGMGPTAGTYGNFRTPSGQAMFGGSPVQGQSFNGMNMGQALGRAQAAQAAWQAAQRPQIMTGPLSGAPTAAVAPSVVPQKPAEVYTPWNPFETEVYTPWNPFEPELPTPPLLTSQYLTGPRIAQPSPLRRAIDGTSQNWTANHTVRNTSWANDPHLGTSAPGGLGRYR